MYSDKWIRKNGAVASSIWIEAIASLTPTQLRLGIDKCKERIFSGNSWAPDMADFLSLIHGQTDIDYHSAFIRCLNKEPQGKVERWVCENAGWNIRTAAHDKAERMHKKFMLEAIEKERRGTLKTNDDMLRALPINSVKNDNDIAIEQYEERNGKKLHPRIEKILRRKE